ncbi:proteasome component region PCI domain-containing protein [Dictyostelium discoideum AX4]|uniref:Eukaryotic translation initiation factor 3 subunit C n=1 Tax=Dictyostelium discoideum TaxID=44689 RepID=EIF3C_DICDI|nr:proteasome component region PCI domain-containing protein [Dictyostelium discoideum AX4]Q54X97.1 RecName: Full=Eukaryotic translation initiation factor 3 subunit C; Short=eIF3c; AltName: Full=Eukaryotic translation initiation factor 3 subunit 8 [Dictyostelium discoideum]EAL67893.1 proteasome component region PCI domain-containing protein [Dictyostelium discoideum AX4]|eukprot:XP_641870.1 proteasome component region PCI domain-containing protein [Dictyostelium discoideum AX4]
MSRFYRQGSSSESSSESSSDSDVQVKKPTRYVSSSEDEIEEKRIVLSAKDKIWQQFDESLKKVRNALKTNDWVSTTSEFDNMTKLITNGKTTRIIEKEGFPPSFIKALFIIQTSHRDLTTEQKKKLHANNNKSYNSIKQKLKKTCDLYAKELKPYHDNPALVNEQENKANSDDDDDDLSESESEESESSDDDKGKGKGKAAFGKKPATKAVVAKKPLTKKGDDDSESESEESESESEELISESWSSDSDDDSDSDSDDDSGDNKWMIKDDKKVVAKASVTTVRKTDKDKLDRRNAVVSPLSGSGSAVPTAGEGEGEKLTQDQIMKKVKEVISNRGKLKTDPMKQIQQLEYFYSLIQGDKETFIVLYELIAAQFDTASVKVALSIPVWQKVADGIKKLLEILETNTNFVLVLEHQEPTISKGQVAVTGNLLALFEMLDDEFSKSLQSINYPTKEYLDRLQDEQIILDLGESLQKYYESAGNNGAAAKIAIRRIEHIYYKSSNLKNNIIPSTMPLSEQITLMSKLSSFVYKFGDERLNARTILCNIYFNAINNKFHEARDMMLMSHLQDNPTLMDVSTQILFNRAMVQLGLCAFRCGYIQEAQNCVVEFSGLRKDLLAQGLSVQSKTAEKDTVREVEETTRILPAHMWIPIDLIETVNLISGMLIAVPQNAYRPFDNKFKTCKFYQRHMDSVDRQIFIAPSETSKDIIYQASKALSAGDWQQCLEHVNTLRFWSLIPDIDSVREKLTRIVQEVSLKTFLFTYSTSYDSILLSELADRFHLPKSQVHSIVAKMMNNHEISASMEHSTESITFRAEQTKLQYLALHYSESLVDFVEQNERIYDVKFGTSYRKKGDNDHLPIAGGQHHGHQHHGHQHHGHHHHNQQQQQHHQQQQQTTQHHHHHHQNQNQGNQQYQNKKHHNSNQQKSHKKRQNNSLVVNN